MVNLADETYCFDFLSSSGLSPPGCSENKSGELYDTAGFEELQNNKDHALQLYQEIIEKYLDSNYAKKAEERISEIEKSNMRR